MEKVRNGKDRMRIFVRIISLSFLIIGMSTAYFTFIASLIPQISFLFYLVSVLFMISGTVIFFSKIIE